MSKWISRARNKNVIVMSQNYLTVRKTLWAKTVLRWRLKVGKDDKETTCCGRLFQVRGATTGNERSPKVDKRVLGTTCMVVDAYRSRRLASMSATRWRSSARYGGTKPCRQRKHRTDSLDIVLVIWVFIETYESKWMLRLRTEAAGKMASDPTRTVKSGAGQLPGGRHFAQISYFYFYICSIQYILL